MANSLLDFVMALVRDPDAAARFAADPAGALAAAQLPGVTIADVNNLMPVVTDSLAAATPNFGAPADSALETVNIWTTGAAVAAFDAFDIQIPPAEQGGATPAISVPAVQVAADPVGASLEAGPVPGISAGGGVPEISPPVEAATSLQGWPEEDRWQDQPHVDLQSETGDSPRFELS